MNCRQTTSKRTTPAEHPEAHVFNLAEVSAVHYFACHGVSLIELKAWEIKST